VVDFEEVNDFGVESRDGSGNAFTARRSWIPGGRITSLLWTWVEEHVRVTDSGMRYSIPGFGKVKDSGDQPHRFILAKPAPFTGAPRWSVLNHICLDITGTQVSSDGVEQPIAGRIGTCKPSSFHWLPTHPPGIRNPLTPIWIPPDVFSPDALVDESIFAHIDAGAVLPTGDFSTNHVVHFANWRADQPLAELNRALGRLRADASLTVAVVLPVGSLRATRRDIEVKLGLLERQREGADLSQTREDRAPMLLGVTEDYEGGWTQTFGVRRLPATFIVNARGESVWQHEGAVDAERLAAALYEHLLPAPPPRARLLALAVRPGERVPEVSVADIRGQTVDLGRLRGTSVLVSFFLSWTKPCISELRRLQELQNRAGNDGPVIVAFCADQDRQSLETLQQQHQFNFSLVQDVDRRVARLFQVSCWPTTVSINAGGIVEHIQFGMMPQRRNRTREQPA
jgi:peroxiredoxin